MGSKVNQRAIKMHQQIDLVSGLHRRREGFLEMSTCWRHLVDSVCHFGAHWISKGRSAQCFSKCLAQPQKLDNIFFNNYTAKIGECKTTKNMKRMKGQSTRSFCMFQRFQERSWGVPHLYSFINFATLGRFWIPFWRPLDF